MYLKKKGRKERKIVIKTDAQYKRILSSSTVFTQYCDRGHDTSAGSHMDLLKF